MNISKITQSRSDRASSNDAKPTLDLAIAQFSPRDVDSYKGLREIRGLMDSLKKQPKFTIIYFEAANKSPEILCCGLDADFNPSLVKIEHIPGRENEPDNLRVSYSNSPLIKGNGEEIQPFVKGAAEFPKLEFRLVGEEINGRKPTDPSVVVTSYTSPTPELAVTSETAEANLAKFFKPGFRYEVFNGAGKFLQTITFSSFQKMKGKGITISDPDGETLTVTKGKSLRFRREPAITFPAIDHRDIRALKDIEIGSRTTLRPKLLHSIQVIQEAAERYQEMLSSIDDDLKQEANLNALHMEALRKLSVAKQQTIAGKVFHCPAKELAYINHAAQIFNHLDAIMRARFEVKEILETNKPKDDSRAVQEEYLKPYRPLINPLVNLKNQVTNMLRIFKAHAEPEIRDFAEKLAKLWDIKL